MQYVMFVVVDPTGEPFVAAEDNYQEFDARPEVGEGHRLRPAVEARTIRTRYGTTVVTDGPFTESREWIAGYGVLECESLDAAVELAAQHPMARFGAIEVREVWQPPFD